MTDDEKTVLCNHSIMAGVKPNSVEQRAAGHRNPVVVAPGYIRTASHENLPGCQRSGLVVYRPGRVHPVAARLPESAGAGSFSRPHLFCLVLDR